MHRKVAILLVAIQMNVCLSACALHKPEDETMPYVFPDMSIASGQYDAVLEETQCVSVVKNEMIDGRNLQIDVEVTIPDIHAMAVIQMGADTEKSNQFVDDWILSKHPNTKSVSSAFQTEWEVKSGDDIYEALCINANNITVNYLNVANDINSSSMEESDLSRFFPHYITRERPPMLNITAEEAAKEASVILSQYSCFTYSPWNVVAFNAETEGGSGTYCMELQPLYNGIPVFDQYRADRIEEVQSAKILAWMSAEGLFSFQGNLFLKETGKTDIERALSLEHAIEKMVEDFPIYAIGKKVSVTGICASYYLQGSAEDTTCTLIPGWAFECRDSAEKSSYERQYTCFYDFESGELHLLQY